MYHLRVTGSPRAMGLTHGEGFRTQIQELAEIRYALIRRRMPGFSEAALHDLAMEQVAVLKGHRDSYDEFVGIAAASGVSEARLMILNNYTDMRDFNSPDEGCSLFAMRSGDRYVCGQTWDMHASARPYVLHLTMEGSPRAEVLTLTGCLGLAGVNEHRLAVLINNLNCAETAMNIMWPALVRGMLAKGTADAAAVHLGKNLPCSGHNYLLCDRDEMMNIETTGKRFEVTYRDARGLVFHTNHYIGGLGGVEMKDKRSPTTVPRYLALARYFAGVHNEVPDLEQLAAGLCSSGIPGNVCVPRTGDDASMTCGGILIDFVEGRGVVFAGSFDEGDHRSFGLPGKSSLNERAESEIA